MNYSRQREAIYDNLAHRFDHPTAETLYQDIQRDFPKISLATVYRNLTQLEEVGQIIKLSNSIGPDRFDANTKPHIHFFCNQCGKVSDLKPSKRFRVKELLDDFEGEIETENIQLYGVCAECKQITH